MSSVMFGITGLASVLVNPLGPVQLKAYSTSLKKLTNSKSCPAHNGPLLKGPQLVEPDPLFCEKMMLQGSWEKFVIKII